MSFFSKIAAEASAALSDAYGHVVHGDDAGASARLVWVVHPTKVPLDIDGGGGGTGGTQPSMISEASSPAGRTGSGYLFTQRFGAFAVLFVCTCASAFSPAALFPVSSRPIT